MYLHNICIFISKSTVFHVVSSFDFQGPPMSQNNNLMNGGSHVMPPPPLVRANNTAPVIG